MMFWFFLLSLLPTPTRDLYVYVDSNIPKPDMTLFRQNHYVIHYRKLADNTPRTALNFLKVAKKAGQQTGGWTLMIRSEAMVHPRFGHSAYRIKGLTGLSEPYMVISRGKTSTAQIDRIIIHEFGHSVGLVHCPAPNCLMNDAKGNLKNIKHSYWFCADCRRKIRPYLPLYP